MSANSTFKEQVQRNMVALISLAIAITSLSYNTWRNEASEHNRNQRLVSIQLLLMLGDLQQLTLDYHYGEKIDADSVHRAAWTKVLTIRDISKIAAGEVPDSAENLYEVWNANYDELGSNVEAKNKVLDALERLRSDTHEVLRNLD
jgi:hypothetical protein